MRPKINIWHFQAIECMNEVIQDEKGSECKTIEVVFMSLQFFEEILTLPREK